MILDCLFVCLFSCFPYRTFPLRTYLNFSTRQQQQQQQQVGSSGGGSNDDDSTCTWIVNVLNNKSTITYPKRFIIFSVTYHFRRFLCAYYMCFVSALWSRDNCFDAIILEHLIQMATFLWRPLNIYTRYSLDECVWCFISVSL